MNQQKLAKLKADRAKTQKLIASQRHAEAIESENKLKESIDRLHELLNAQEPVDIDKLSEQIESLRSVIDIQDQVQAIQEAVKAIKPEVHTEKIDLSAVIDAIKENQPKEYDFSVFEKAIVEIQQRVQDNVVEESQAPDDYKPFRRVVKQGNVLIYDDQPTPSRAGGGSTGGGSTSGGLTDAELRASPVDVDTGLTQPTTPLDTQPISATDLDIRNLVFATDKVDATGTVLGAGTNNIGDVDVLTVPTDPFGANADASSASGSISAKLRFIATTGIPITNTVTVGSHAVTNAGTFATQPSVSATAVGVTISKTDALVATAVAVKASAGNVYGYHIYNSNSADAFVHFYNIAQGSVTVGSSTRIYTIFVPGGGVLDTSLAFPISFSTAITIAATTTITGSGAPSTGLLTDIMYI